MKATLRIGGLAGLLALLGAMLVACDATGLSNTPRATFSQVACLDINGDDVVNAQDAQDPSKLPDFNADDERDQLDAAFLFGVEIPLDPNADPCGEEQPDTPEYAVAHGYFSPAEVSCEEGESPVLLLGVGGGDVNLKEKRDAAGIRSTIDALQDAYDDRDVETLAVLAGPAVHGAQNVHAAMEAWLSHALRVYFERYPCLRAVLVGHSHGATSVDVVSARLEDEYGDRFVLVVDVDRVTELYDGDTQSRPVVAPVFNIYTDDPVFGSEAYASPNAENFDASNELAPADGDQGGALMPVTHTTVDNSESVRARIVREVIERS